MRQNLGAGANCQAKLDLLKLSSWSVAPHPFTHFSYHTPCWNQKELFMWTKYKLACRVSLTVSCISCQHLEIRIFCLKIWVSSFYGKKKNEKFLATLNSHIQMIAIPGVKQRVVCSSLQCPYQSHCPISACVHHCLGARSFWICDQFTN